jgi:hypothetical protein
VFGGLGLFLKVKKVELFAFMLLNLAFQITGHSLERPMNSKEIALSVAGWQQGDGLRPRSCLPFRSVSAGVELIYVIKIDHTGEFVTHPSQVI